MLWRTTRYAPYECVATPAELARQRSTMHPRSLILGLESAAACDSCPHRQLSVPGGRFFDHVRLADWKLIVLKQAVSTSVGVMAILYTVLRLLTLLKGEP